MQLISGVLYYVVNELNKATRFVYSEFKPTSSSSTPEKSPGENHNIFDLLLNCF